MRTTANHPFAPSPIALVNLGVFAVFMCVAGIGTLVPQIVVDRRPKQFLPIWERALASPDPEWQHLPVTMAAASQWAIGGVELTVGLLGLLALVIPGQRRWLSAVSLCGATSLFGMFMIVLFYLHESELPKWSQYPPLLIWIAVTWLLMNGVPQNDQSTTVHSPHPTRP